jgi:hypothetical protein
VALSDCHGDEPERLGDELVGDRVSDCTTCTRKSEVEGAKGGEEENGKERDATEEIKTEKDKLRSRARTTGATRTRTWKQKKRSEKGRTPS